MTTLGQTLLSHGVWCLPFLWEAALCESAWSSCVQLSAWGAPPALQAQPGWQPWSQRGFCSPGLAKPYGYRGKPKRLTSLKKGPAQIKHTDGVSRPVHGLVGICADGKSRVPNSSAVILPQQRHREVQDLQLRVAGKSQWLDFNQGISSQG